MEPIKVMLVDDDPNLIQHLSRLISADQRFKLVNAVRSSYEAVAYAVQSSPHVIVMDIEMETKLAGLYATREILRFVPQCKVIIYTHHSDSYYIAKAFQFGALDYLVKPVSDQELLNTLFQSASGESGIHPHAAAYLRTRYAQLENAQDNLNYIIRIILLLTPTELEILKMMHAGMKQKEIARVRFIEMTTMKTHISNILKKFDRRTMSEVLQTMDDIGLFDMLDAAT